MKIPKSLKKLFFSYLLVFCIPAVILSFLCFTYLINEFQKMSMDLRKDEQQREVQQLDNNFEQIKNMVIQLNMQNDISFQNLDENIGNRINLIGRLNYLLSVNDGIKEIVLYFPGSDMLYSSEGTFSIETYGEINGIDMNHFIQKMTNNKSSGNGLLPVVNDNEKSSKYFYLACPYPLNSPYPSGYIIFKMITSRFVTLEEKDYCVLYRNNIVVNTTDNQLITGEQMKSTINIRGDYSIISTKSSLNDITLNSVVNNKVAFNKFYIIRKLFIFIDLLVFLISLTVLTYFSYKNYKPLSNLKKTLIKLGVKPNIASKEPEISQSIRAIEMLSSNNKILDDSILRERKITRGFLLSKLINNQYDNINELNQELRQYNFDPCGGSYAVCVMNLNISFDDALYAEQLDLNLSDLFLDDDFKFYCYKDTVNRIVGVSGGGSDLKNELQKYLNKIAEEFKERDIEYEIAVGCFYKDIGDINLSYIDAIAMIDYDDMSYGKIHFCKEALAKNKHVFYPQSELNSLASAIRDRDAINIVEITKTISSILISKVYDMPFAKTVCYEVVNTIFKSFDKYDESIGDILNKSICRLNKISTRKETCELVENIGQNIAKILQKTEPFDLSSNKLTEIEMYITHNFDKQDFYLGNVAELYHISLNNLSQQLKKYLGVSPMKYITMLRIEKAKQLLTNTETAVKDIALEVGFAGSSSFIRAFKSITSTTPIRYRQLYGRENSVQEIQEQ